MSLTYCKAFPSGIVVQWCSSLYSVYLAICFQLFRPALRWAATTTLSAERTWRWLAELAALSTAHQVLRGSITVDSIYTVRHSLLRMITEHTLVWGSVSPSNRLLCHSMQDTWPSTRAMSTSGGEFSTLITVIVLAITQTSISVELTRGLLRQWKFRVSIIRHYFDKFYRRNVAYIRVVSAYDCGVRGSRFESRRWHLWLSRQLLRYTVLSTGCAPLLQCLGRLSLPPFVGR